MTFDDALTVLSDTDQKGKLAMSQKYGDMLRATSEAMQVARECIKRCRDFSELRAKVGKTIYFAYLDENYPDESEVVEYEIQDASAAGDVYIADGWCDPADPRECLFWTREAAEKALAEMKAAKKGGADDR